MSHVPSPAGMSVQRARYDPGGMPGAGVETEFVSTRYPVYSYECPATSGKRFAVIGWTVVSGLVVESFLHPAPRSAARARRSAAWRMVGSCGRGGNELLPGKIRNASPRFKTKDTLPRRRLSSGPVIAPASN